MGKISKLMPIQSHGTNTIFFKKHNLIIRVCTYTYKRTLFPNHYDIMDIQWLTHNLLTKWYLMVAVKATNLKDLAITLHNGICCQLLIYRPISTHQVVWPISCQLPSLRRPFSGTQFMLGRPGKFVLVGKQTHSNWASRQAYYSSSKNGDVVIILLKITN